MNTSIRIRPQTMLRRSFLLTAAAATTALLTACGGGGGDSGSGGGGVGGGGGGGGTTTYIYSVQPPATSRVDALALYNAQGALGNAFISSFTLSGGALTELFVRRSGNATYSYVGVDQTAANSTPTGFVQLLNSQGQQGFIFKGPLLLPGSSVTTFLFVKNNSKTTSYSYQSSPTGSDEAAMLSDLNTKGTGGYAYLGDIVLDASTPTITPANAIRLFVRDNTNSASSSPASYRYEFTPLLGSRTTLLAELNSKGSTGAAWKGPYSLGTTRLRSLYETTGSTPVVYTMEATVLSTTTALLQQLNAQGAQGSFFAGEYVVGTDSVQVFYRGPLTAYPLIGTVIP